MSKFSYLSANVCRGKFFSLRPPPLHWWNLQLCITKTTRRLPKEESLLCCCYHGGFFPSPPPPPPPPPRVFRVPCCAGCPSSLRFAPAPNQPFPPPSCPYYGREREKNLFLSLLLSLNCRVIIEFKIVSLTFFWLPNCADLLFHSPPFIPGFFFKSSHTRTIGTQDVLLVGLKYYVYCCFQLAGGVAVFLRLCTCIISSFLGSPLQVRSPAPLGAVPPPWQLSPLTLPRDDVT